MKPNGSALAPRCHKNGCCAESVKTRNVGRQAGLADDGTGGADGQFLLRMGNAMRPAASLYLAWLPFWEAKKKPCAWAHG
jgi:hypothetical protein